MERRRCGRRQARGQCARPKEASHHDSSHRKLRAYGLDKGLDTLIFAHFVGDDCRRGRRVGCAGARSPPPAPAHAWCLPRPSRPAATAATAAAVRHAYHNGFCDKKWGFAACRRREGLPGAPPTPPRGAAARPRPADAAHGARRWGGGTPAGGDHAAGTAASRRRARRAAPRRPRRALAAPHRRPPPRPRAAVGRARLPGGGVAEGSRCRGPAEEPRPPVGVGAGEAAVAWRPAAGAVAGPPPCRPRCPSSPLRPAMAVAAVHTVAQSPGGTAAPRTGKKQTTPTPLQAAVLPLPVSTIHVGQPSGRETSPRRAGRHAFCPRSPAQYPPSM